LAAHAIDFRAYALPLSMGLFLETLGKTALRERVRPSHHLQNIRLL
jgi:hypothetical protein